MPTPPSDLADLIAATACRDKAAFEQLYGRTAAKLLGIVLRIVRDRAIAEDVVQEVFLSVWQKAGRFDPAIGRPMTWLISVARYRAIDTLRQRRDGLLANDGDLEGLRDTAEGRDLPADHAELAQLRLCLGKLDETHRRCLLEAYYLGYSRDELAERFAKPVNTIKTWLHRSAASLRSCLEAG